MISALSIEGKQNRDERRRTTMTNTMFISNKAEQELNCHMSSSPVASASASASTGKDTTTSLVDLLTRPFNGQILECLRIADIQRLIVCCSELKDLKTSNPATEAIVTWLKDLEFFYCLDCPKPLFRKVSESMRKYPGRYRLMSNETGNSPKIHGNTLFEAFEHAWTNCYFADIYDEVPLRFARTSSSTLDNWCVYEGDAYGNIEPSISDTDSDSNSDSDSDSDSNSDSNSESDSESDVLLSRKKLRKLECSSIFCKHRGRCNRLYFVRDKPYCGACLVQF